MSRNGTLRASGVKLPKQAANARLRQTLGPERSLERCTGRALLPPEYENLSRWPEGTVDHAMTITPCVHETETREPRGAKLGYRGIEIMLGPSSLAP